MFQVPRGFLLRIVGTGFENMLELKEAAFKIADLEELHLILNERAERVAARLPMCAGAIRTCNLYQINTAFQVLLGKLDSRRWRRNRCARPAGNRGICEDFELRESGGWWIVDSG